MALITANNNVFEVMCSEPRKETIPMVQPVKWFRKKGFSVKMSLNKVFTFPVKILSTGTSTSSLK